jgi:pimeloyl-ACP methyl ester carboxylesterase
MGEFVTSADGTELAVRRLGSGPPVVMLHGSGGGLHSWEEVGRRLAGEYTVWLVARRGYAPSGVPDGRKSFADEVADVHALLAAAGDGVHLVGSSYGATVALHAALALPLRSLSLYEPPLFASGPRLEPVLAQYRERLADGDAAGATLLFLEQVARVPAALLAALGGADADPDEAIGSLHDLEAMASDSEDLARWAAVDPPVLLMQGADTWEPMPRTIDGLARALPHVERVIWEGQMHFAASTAPDLVADTLRRFLREIAA